MTTVKQFIKGKDIFVVENQEVKSAEYISRSPNGWHYVLFQEDGRVQGYGEAQVFDNPFESRDYLISEMRKALNKKTQDFLAEVIKKMGEAEAAKEVSKKA